MASEFTILPRRGMCYFRNFGHCTLAEAIATFEAFAAHPDMYPGQNHLVDCADVTSVEYDVVGFMKMQANLIKELTVEGSPHLLVLYGPTGVGNAYVRTILNTWDGFNVATVRMASSEAEALSILGQPEQSFAELLRETGARLTVPQAPSAD